MLIKIKWLSKNTCVVKIVLCKNFTFDLRFKKYKEYCSEKMKAAYMVNRLSPPEILV